MLSLISSGGGASAKSAPASFLGNLFRASSSKFAYSNRRPFAAFTMAEVLITLGVIGIVAAMTLPTVITKYRKQVTVTSLKKFYTVMAQAIEQSSLDNGSPEYWSIAPVKNGEIYTDYADTEQFFNLYLKKYLKVMVYCGEKAGCWAENESQPNGITPASSLNSLKGTVKFVLNDGYAVTLLGSSTYVIVYVDLNGMKKPNRRGIDIFEFRIDLYNSNKIFFHPYLPNIESPYKPENIICTPTNGYRCAAKIMSDGWKISDDYPWF